MKLKISISRKMMAMVLLPIIGICILVGFVSSNILYSTITDEIEKQLCVSAYNFKSEYEITNGHGLNDLIQNFKNDNNIDVTIFEDNIRSLSTVENAVGTEMSNEIYELIQYGDSYFTTNANVNGEKYFGYYIPIMENNQYIGASFTGIPQIDAQTTITRNVIKIIGFVILCGIISGIISFIMIRKIVKSIKRLESTIGTLLNNDLTVIHKKYEFEHDEVESINNKSIDFSNHLNNTISQIKNTSRNLKDIASDLKLNIQFTNDNCNQISQAIENVASGAVSQAEDTTNAAQNASDMMDELSQIKNDVNALSSIATSMNDTKNTTIRTLNNLQEVNGVIVNKMESTNKQVHATNDSVEQIKKAVEMIQDIASQTHLLSLNASIEAARAGDNGKGFAVVAEEIGKLASQSAESSKEIEDILKTLVNNYDEIIENVNDTSKNIDTQIVKLSETKESFSNLENDINETIEQISEINIMIEKIDVEIGKMVDMISNLSAISEENSASTEQTMASIQELNATINQIYEKSQIVDSSSDALINEVNIFKTK